MFTVEITALVELTQNDLDLAGLHAAIGNEFEFDCHIAQLVDEMDPATMWKRASKQIRIREEKD